MKNLEELDVNAYACSVYDAAFTSASLKVLDFSRTHFKSSYFISVLSCPNLRRLICGAAGFGNCVGVCWDRTAESQSAQDAREAFQQLDPANKGTIPVAGQRFLAGSPNPGFARAPSAVAMDVSAGCVVEFHHDAQ